MNISVNVDLESVVDDLSEAELKELIAYSFAKLIRDNLNPIAAIITMLEDATTPKGQPS